MVGLILDAGCGRRCGGDVRVDLNRAVKPDVVCDLNMALPFRDKSVDEVYSCHVLEHLDNPVKSLKEFMRVAKLKVTVIVPWRNMPARSEWRTDSRHKWMFTKKWFRRVLDGHIYETYISRYHWPILLLPIEIKVEIKVE